MQKTQNKSEKKQNIIIKSISDVFRRLSITVNLTVYSIYLIYLIYSISAGVGLLYVNIALAILTAAFMVVYLVLRLSSKRRGKEIKQIKRYYKRFKLVARAVTSITAVYALFVAIDSVSPFAIILSLLGAIFVIIRLIVELISYFIQRKLRKIKDSIVGRFKRRRDDDIEVVMPAEDEERQPRRKRKRKENTTIFDEIEEKIVPIDDCLLSDIDQI